MSTGFTLDMREFNRTFRQYAALNKRKLPQIINAKLYTIAKKAQDYTPKADRAQIMAELGATSYQSVSRKTGKTTTRNRYKPTRLVNRIVQSRRRKKGLEPLAKAELRKEARKLIAARLRGVGTLKAGFVRGLWSLAKAAKLYIPYSRNLPKVKRVSKAWEARPGWNPKAMFQYRTLARPHGRSSLQVHPEVVKAFNKAWQWGIKDMKQYIARKMRPDARRISAR